LDLFISQLAPPHHQQKKRNTFSGQLDGLWGQGGGGGEESAHHALIDDLGALGDGLAGVVGDGVRVA